jgi:N-acetylmuramoyl-L-alanine amidase
VNHPAILMEGGFMSHPHEARLIDHSAYQNAIATSIVDAITKYRFAVSGGSQTAATR